MAVQGLLLDLEGVIYIGSEPVAGAEAALSRLRKQGLAMRYLTNTTTLPRDSILARLRDMGIEASREDVLTPAIAARRLLHRADVHRVHLAAPDPLAADFGDFELVKAKPEAVVLGDLYRSFDWDRLNDLFAMLHEGARLVALHRNRVCRRGDTIALDLGPFVAALEYAANVKATVVGKPSPEFFSTAIESLGLEAASVVMVGDDIEADIGGARIAGARAIQVCTGKYTPADDSRERFAPDARIDSVADLPDLLESWHRR